MAGGARRSAPYLDDRPPARICTLMARIEAGEGDKGREREWLARAVRAPRDRAWIADGYVSDRWLPVSPVTGAVDAFEWKAPVDAIGRGDETLLIEERHEPPEPPRRPPLSRGPRRESGKGRDGRAEEARAAAPRAVPSSDGARSRGATIAPATPVVPREQPGQARSPSFSCRRPSPTIRAWRRPRPTKARPLWSACAPRKSADFGRPAGAPELATPGHWH